MTGSNIWDQVLSRIEAKVNRHSFYTWFKPTSFVADDGAIRVRVPNALFSDWLTKHYSVSSRKLSGKSNGPDHRSSFVTEEHRRRASRSRFLTDAIEPRSNQRRVVGRAASSPRYSFDTFIVGPSNQFAHAACRAVAERRRAPTTRCSSTAAWDWARRT